MIFTHDIDQCFADRIGEGGLDRRDFDATVAATGRALDRLRDQARSGALPLLGVPGKSDDLAGLAPIVRRFRERFDDVVVLGTGGSSLGGQTLAALKHWPPAAPRRKGSPPRTHFMDNIDPASFETLFAGVDVARTGFIVISKSGSTAETATQFFHCVAEIIKRGGEKAVAEQTVAITEPAMGGKENPLRRAAKRWAIPVLDHDPGIGGRYSVLTNVGLLPAMIAGVDGARVRAGAKASLDQSLDAKTPADSFAAVGAALNVALLRQKGVRQSVLMPYVDRLFPFAFWYRQLWAESLGKNGHGTTPINALGTVDQHSQLQLYLGGPNDKLYTLIFGPAAGTGPVIDARLASEPEFSYLVGRTMGDLLDAEQRATAATLARNGRPVRILHLPKVDEETMGAMMMHYMLETIVTADLLGVDPFDQPAVEEGKVLARQYLSEMTAQQAKGTRTA
jgi:glucose-6-phosphate isomerase